MPKIKILLLFICLALVFSCSKKPEIKPDEAFDAERAFAKANEQMEKKNYDEARTIFFEIKNRDLTKKYAPLAQLRIADSYTREQEPEKAVDEYKRFIEIYPEHKYAAYAQYQIAMIYFNQIESSERGYGATTKALEELERLKQMYPRNQYKEIIEARIEKCREVLAEYELIVGIFYYKKDSFDAAIKRLEGVLKKYPGFKKEADAFFHLGMSYKKLGDKNKASEYLKLLLDKYPASPLANDAKKELASLNKK